MKAARYALVLAAFLSLGVPLIATGAGKTSATGTRTEILPGRPKAAKGIDPKPISDNVKKGTAYLVKHQQPDGGWGEGEESASMGASGKMINVSNVADTSIAVLSLFRAGSTPSTGTHSKSVLKGIEFVIAAVEKSDDDSLFVTDVRGTRVQSKIGVYVDTFLSSLVLAEVKGTMPDAKGEKRLTAALEKVVRKIEKNQQADGTYSGNSGWASVLSTGLAGKSLNRAAQAGVDVDDRALARSEKMAVASYDTKSGAFKSAGSTGAGAPSDAGVAIYNVSAQVANLSESVNTSASVEKEMQQVLADPKAPKKAKDEARKRIDSIEATRKVSDQATKSTIARLGEAGFVSGFGSNGGEEFLSYMNISESLVQKGGKDWEKWDREISANLNRVQNGDGSWSGHHCITGRTFVTSTALLVLTADRLGVNAAGVSTASLDPKVIEKVEKKTDKTDQKTDVATKEPSWYEKLWSGGDEKEK